MDVPRRAGRKGTRRRLLALGGAVLAIAACAASAGASRTEEPSGGECRWGASSITASYDSGQLVVSEPQTTGCVSPGPR
jgi:hypothetical protein